MSAHNLATQDMLEVLAKVQSDPESKLFAQGIQLGRPQSTEQPLTGSEPFLSAAERKLVRAYREQVEAFLYARAFRYIRDSNWGQQKLVNHRENCSGATEGGDSSAIAQKLSSKIPSLIDRVTGECKPVQDLQLSLSLVPTCRARIMLGIAYQAEGQIAPAVEVLAAIERSRSSNKNIAIAAANRALIHWDQAEFVPAARAYQSSLMSNPEDGRVGVFALTSALATGDRGYASNIDQLLNAAETAFSTQAVSEALHTSSLQGARDAIDVSVLGGFRVMSKTGQQVLQFLIQ